MTNISERLRELRLNTKKTLKEMSKTLDVSLNTVYRWEHSLSVPRKSVLKKISDYYAVPLEWLIYGNAGENNIMSAPDSSTEQKIMEMVKNLTEQSKYRVLGYIERICVENED
ncbi:MAG: helix-turn-helix domain-containing protein [Oscillospiraceae bacterium]|nr:helix-turn-helix domain-containing protein [Oscillospiraceae bacterium]